MAVQKDINEALINDILMIYSSAEDKMLKAVAKRVAKGITEEGWNERKLKDVQLLNKEIQKILGDTKKLSDAKVSQGIIDSYKAGVQEVDGQKGLHETILDDINVPMNLKMQVLATNNLLSNASFQVLRKSDDAYQKVMAHATTGLLAGVDTRRQASQKMLNEFAAKGITSFVDKAGRNWDLSSYAEMCARTVSHNAARQGHFDRQIEVGEDLVKVSKIGTTCPICQRWQGVVLSISGNHPKYHSVEEAKAAGLFHPNCKHTFNLYIPELDEGTKYEGKVEPSPYDPNTQSSQQYYQIQKQRAHERSIRYWKKRRALAITAEEEQKANENIKKYQYKNLIHCEKYGLRRNYAREGVMSGNATGPQGPLTGGSLKEYEDAFKAIIGQNPKPLYKLNLQFFSEKTYEKWLKDEIASLDELDVDKAMMKDANNKNVTPTSLYKKYIGDNPGQDYAAVSEYEKGTKEYKSGYAKWLKTQIEEIGVSYKVKPKYVEVHEDIPDEDLKLSATEMFKKYKGDLPTAVYKDLGGEAGTGMKYGKWVETQKKELIKNGITKTVPFNEATHKTSQVISQATQTIASAKATAKKIELDKYKKELDDTVHGNYDGYLAVKKALENVNKKYSEKGSATDSEVKMELEKFKLAKEKHLEMVEKKAKKLYGTQAFEDEYKKIINMYIDEDDSDMEEHLAEQMKVYKKVKAEEEQKILDAEAKKQAAMKKANKKAGVSNVVSIGRSTRFDEGKLVKSEDIYQDIDYNDLENLSKQARGHELFEANRRDILGRDANGRNHHMGHDVRLKSGLDAEDKKLGEAFQLAYDEYFNTIKCQPINRAYLDYDNATPSMKKKIDAIRTCIQANETAEPIRLHRFMSDETMEALFGTSDMSTLQAGSLYDNDTFMSTTVGGHPTFGQRKYKLTLEVDKGTHVLPTLNYEEGEVLLDKGKLEVVAVNKHTKSKPQKLKNYDGSYTEFVGDEVVVRYVEDGKAYLYEEVTPEKMDNMLGQSAKVSKHTSESKDWISSLSSGEKTANKKYTGSWYGQINDVYRRNNRGNKDYVKWAEDLTTSLRRIQTEEPIVLRRGIYESDLAYMLGFNGDFSEVKKHWDEINKGGYAAEDKGFLSTSPYKHGGFTSKPVELRIYTPAGTHAAYVDSISSHRGEQETILQSGSMYKVHKLDVDPVSGKTIAYIELLGTD